MRSGQTEPAAASPGVQLSAPICTAEQKQEALPSHSSYTPCLWYVVFVVGIRGVFALWWDGRNALFGAAGKVRFQVKEDDTPGGWGGDMWLDLEVFLPLCILLSFMLFGYVICRVDVFYLSPVTPRLPDRLCHQRDCPFCECGCFFWGTSRGCAFRGWLA